MENLISFILALKDFIPHIKNYWTRTIPSRKVLGPLADNKKLLRIFIRDASSKGVMLQVREGLYSSWGYMQNVFDFWPRVEGFAIVNLANVLGKNGKLENLEIIEMGSDSGLWDSNLIVIGAQSQKSFDFYKNMEQVKYHITRNQIYETDTKKKIPRHPDYGYGIILKTRNPLGKSDGSYGLLLGGFGTLGTEAASYYFKEHLHVLGKLFGNKCFGVVVRAPVSAGSAAVVRLTKYDRIGN